MLKKCLRLKSYSAFIATYRQKRIVSDDNIILHGGKNKETEQNYPTRVGFVVSKKIHKRAVKRNKIKRHLREAYAMALKNNEIPSVCNFQSLIFTAKEGALEADYKQMCSSVKNLVNLLATKYF